MNKALRKAVIAGNWKMNNTPAETTALLEEMKPLVADADCDVIICAPFVDLQAALDATKGSNIQVGAENCHWAEKGAFTAEVSAPMLKAMGVPYVIIGHSERRQYFGETNETVNKRVRAALDNGLKVILCVGEVLEEREPVWAIGTGKTATADQANEVNGYIRSVIAQLYGQAAADAFVVQYGGSMNAGNAEELLAKEHVDGGLIGGASLKAKDFSVIVKAASK